MIYIEMKKSDFVKQLSEHCEFEDDNITAETAFKSINGYDSLAVMSIIAFVDEKFGRKLTALQLRELKDFNSLMTAIGAEHFEND
jgi:acyl carrier protein